MINKNYFLLWSGKIISEIGDKFYAIAMAWWILMKTNSPAAMGAFMAASMLPQLIIGIFSGPLIDRWNRRSILVVSDLLRGLLIFGVFLLSRFEILEIWHVIASAAAVSMATAFFDPSVQAVIPEIVEAEKLPKANALNQLVEGICMVIGPILGAAAVSFLGYASVFLINGISYLAAAIFEALMTVNPTNRTSAEGNLWMEIKDGFRFVMSQKRVAVIIATIGIAHFFIGGVTVAIPFLAKGLAGDGVRNLGNLEMAMGIGLLLGSLYFSIKSKSRLKDQYLFWIMTGVGSCLFGIGMVQLLRVNAVIPYMGILLFLGVAIVNASVFWQSLLQTNTPNQIAGRIFSVSSLVGNVSLPIAYGLFGMILNYQPLWVLMITSGIALAAISTVFRIFYENLGEKKLKMEFE
ncbi:MAG: MFS transporter [Clostridia bacterium]|nr:MFS transporter [Clostridia bacterium]